MPYCPLCGHEVAAGTYSCPHCRRNVPLDAAGRPALLDVPPAPPVAEIVARPDGTQMRKCPHCAELIQPDAKICRFCQRDVAVVHTPLLPTAPATTAQKSVMGCLSAIGILVVLSWCANAINKPSNSRVESGRLSGGASASDGEPVLALLSANGTETETGSYVTVEGQVQNLTSRSLRNVEVVATWMDANGRFITTDSALIEYNPLLPGQISPFKSITRGNPEMKRYTVAFKQFAGGTLFTTDRSGKNALTK